MGNQQPSSEQEKAQRPAERRTQEAIACGSGARPTGRRYGLCSCESMRSSKNYWDGPASRCLARVAARAVFVWKEGELVCRLIDVQPRDYKFSGIYKLTNTINQKVYIGQSKNIGRRMNEYKHGYFNVHLTRAVGTYGIETIEMDVIERCPPADLDDREEYWIAFYDSTNQTKGYNICRRTTDHRGVSPSPETKERMRQHMLSRLTDEYRQQLLDWARLSGEQKSIAVCKLDTITGKVCATFPSIAAAASAVSVAPACIIRACALRRDGIHCESSGYCWCYESEAVGLEYVDVHPINVHVGQRGSPTAISQFDKATGELIAVYSSAMNAQRDTGILATSISSCCRSFARGYGKRHSAGGYVWKFSTEDDLKTFILAGDKSPNKQAS